MWCILLTQSYSLRSIPCTMFSDRIASLYYLTVSAYALTVRAHGVVVPWISVQWLELFDSLLPLSRFVSTCTEPTLVSHLLTTTISLVFWVLTVDQSPILCHINYFPSCCISKSLKYRAISSANCVSHYSHHFQLQLHNSVPYQIPPMFESTLIPAPAHTCC